MRKRNILSLLALGTACSILLQSTLCYSLALASETGQNASNEATIDEASMFISGAMPPGLDPSSMMASDNEVVIDSSTIDAAREATQRTPETKALATDTQNLLALASDASPTTDSHDNALSVSDSGRLVAASDGATLKGGVVIDDVERSTKQIVAKIFELERLNTYFRIESTKQSKWRKWRNFAGNEAAAQIVGAGVLVFIIYSLRGVHRGATPTRIKFHNLVVTGKFYKQPPNTRLENGIITTIPGIWIGVLQEFWELSENYIHDMRAKQRGFDAKTTRAKATQLQGEIDKMLAERAGLVNSASSSPQEHEIELAEGKVLKDMRDLTLKEYVGYYAGSKRLRGYQNVFWLTDIAERTTGFASLFMGLISLHIGTAGRNRLGSLGVLQCVSAVLAPLAPITAGVYSHYKGEAAERSLSRDIYNIEAKSPDVFDADRKHLEDLVLNSGSSSSVGSAWSARMPLYRLEKENLFSLQALKDRERRDYKSDFWQTLGVRMFAFGNKTAFGAVAMAGGWTHLNNPRHFDELLLGATTPYYVTLETAGADTLRRHISNLVQTRHDRAKGYLPTQIYKSRLDNLDKMETVINPGKRWGNH